MRTLTLCSTLIFASCTSGSQAAESPSTPPTHGVLVGEVHSDRARVWARSDHAAYMHVEVWPKLETLKAAQVSKHVGPETDFAASVDIKGLRAGTPYLAKVWFSAERSGRAIRESEQQTAAFSTAPAADDARAVRFAWSGDLAGQNAGRDVALGFGIMPHIVERAPEFFIGLGDMIYGDNTCEPIGLYKNAQVPGDFPPSATLDAYRAHWRYNRADQGFQKLLACTPYFGVWDDHEVVNDFSPTEDTRSEAPYTAREHLMPLGLRAFYEYNAIDDSGDGRLYRSVRWGKHLELFFLDNRRYRDPNRARDDSPKPKTQLGSAQVDWLEGALKASDATWRIVITSVPISVPTGTPEARDGWANADGATGYERELALLFATMHVRGIDNTIWLSTDVHFATGFEYTPFAEAPQFHLREFICGPLNAGIFPKQDLDPTFRPRRLFFYGPPKTPESYAEALSWFNFGVISIDGSGRLTVEIVNGLGATVASESFTR